MKYVILVLFLALCNNGEGISSPHESELYYKAYQTITSNEDFKAFVDKNELWVSPRLLSFDVLGWYFQKEISTYIPGYEVLNTSGEELYVDSISLFDETIDINSRYRLFFTEINQNLVLAEIVESLHMSEDYMSATLLSKGIVFLITVKNDTLEIVKHMQVDHD